MLLYSFLIYFLNLLQYWLGFPAYGGALCLNHGSVKTLHQLVLCLDQYTVPEGYYGKSTYEDAQPTLEQRAAWSETISALLQVESDCDCLSISLPPSLDESYAVSLFTESDGTFYCVLSETRLLGGYFAKGWGTFVVPASRTWAPRHLHFSAPHPAYDLHTPEQAAALFKSMNAKSLLIAGRSRLAYKASTDCVRGNAVYYKTDPAHDKSQPFFDASKATMAWQNANGGCPGETCAFIQLHGKGASTCRYDQIFMSSGIEDPLWYTNGVDRPIKRLRTHLRNKFPQWNVSFPSDSSCKLRATKNIVGRMLNGVPESKVCTTGSASDLATGAFIHIEQAAVSRGESVYAAWANALRLAFQIAP